MGFGLLGLQGTIATNPFSGSAVSLLLPGFLARWLSQRLQVLRDTVIL